MYYQWATGKELFLPFLWESFEAMVVGFNLSWSILCDGDDDGDDDEHYAHEVIQRMLAAKDEGLVSAEAYHKLRMALLEKVSSHVPPLSVIKQERRSQNKEIKVIQIPEIN